jgi:hypothetical protein
MWSIGSSWLPGGDHKPSAPGDQFFSRSVERKPVRLTARRTGGSSAALPSVGADGDRHLVRLVMTYRKTVNYGRVRSPSCWLRPIAIPPMLCFHSAYS